eukprot:8492070-Alexandrium_andersonii.AAC.1
MSLQPSRGSAATERARSRDSPRARTSPARRLRAAGGDGPLCNLACFGEHDGAEPHAVSR